MPKKNASAVRRTHTRHHPYEMRVVVGLIAMLVVAAAIQSPLQHRTPLAASVFPDIQENSLEMLAAESLKNIGVFQGYPDGTFRGVLVLNRAQAAKIILIASETKVIQARNAGFFKDMPQTDWYVPFVITAALKGIVSGYPDGTFKPDQNVNTAEFLKMMNIAFGLQTYMPHSYPDVSPTEWYGKYAGMARQYELFPYRDGFLGPNLPITRTEAAIALYQYLKLIDAQQHASSSAASSIASLSFFPFSSSADTSSSTPSSSFESSSSIDMLSSSSAASIAESSSSSASSLGSVRPSLCGDGRCDAAEENPCLLQGCAPGFICPACTPPPEYCASDCP